MGFNTPAFRHSNTPINRKIGMPRVTPARAAAWVPLRVRSYCSFLDATLSPAATDDEAAPSHPQDSPKAAPTTVAPVPPEQSEPPAAPEPETAEEAAERERRYREIFGIPEPKRRRPWQRSQTSWPGTT